MPLVPGLPAWVFGLLMDLKFEGMRPALKHAGNHPLAPCLTAKALAAEYLRHLACLAAPPKQKFRPSKKTIDA